MPSHSGVRWRSLIASIVVCQAAGGLGAVFTNDGLKRWYPSLKKPSFTPPGAIFGPVWTTLYLLIGIARYLVGQNASNEEDERRATYLFGLQLGLNAAWPYIFFRRRAPLAALAELVGLWCAILLTIRSFARVSRPAAMLLIPYLLWSSFATVLNAAIWWLNRNDR